MKKLCSSMNLVFRLDGPGASVIGRDSACRRAEKNPCKDLPDDVGAKPYFVRQSRQNFWT
jgi:hypothetical protein